MYILTMDLKPHAIMSAETMLIFIILARIGTNQTDDDIVIVAI